MQGVRKARYDIQYSGGRESTQMRGMRWLETLEMIKAKVHKNEKEILKNQNLFYNDIYCAFLIKSLDWIDSGIVGFLVPKSFLLKLTVGAAICFIKE